MLCISTAWAQEPPPVPENPASGSGGAIPARILGDHLLIKAVMQNQAGYREVHLLLDYSSDKAFDVHQGVFQGLMSQFGEDETTLKLVADGFHVEVHKDAITASTNPAMDDLNDRYETEMEDIAVTAIIGTPTLKAFNLAFDTEAEQIVMTPAGDSEIEQVAASHDMLLVGVEFTPGRVTLPVMHSGDQDALMQFGTAGYHTYLDQDAANAMGYPAGDLPDLRFGTALSPGANISGMVALFPQPFEEADSDLLLKSGLGLWSSYNFEINLRQGYLALTRMRDNNFRQEDFAFYSASAARDREELWAYVERYPDDRNIEEAANRLFDIGLDEGAPVEEQMKALGKGLEVTKDSRKLTYVLSRLGPLYADEENREANTDLILAVGEEAQKYVARSKNPGARQDVQMMMGELLLARGDAHEAWKYYLAAAFNGDPNKEMQTRLGLARAYAALDRHRRAYSNFRRVWDSLPSPEDPPQGLVDFKSELRAEMDAVAEHMDADDPLLLPAAGS